MLLMPASNLQVRRKFDPRQISGLGLWLDASDASTITIATGVSAWNDKSGNGRNFAQADTAKQPAQITAGQNGRNTVRGDGADDLMTCSSGLNLLRNVGGASLFAVRKWVTSPSSGKIILGVSVGTSTNNRASLNGGTTANKSILAGRRLDADASGINMASSADVSAGFQIQNGLFDYTNSDLYQYIDGALDGSTTSFQTDGNTQDTDSQVIYMFDNTSGSVVANAELAEGLIWPRFLTTLERQQVEGYLAHKWGLASSLPSTHPYRFAAP